MKKRSGIKAKDIIRDLLSLRLNNISVGTNAISLDVDTLSNSDAVYNYQKHSENNVLELTTRLSKEVYLALNESESEDSLLEGGAFIIDDTTYKRLYSKETEMASSQFDHTNGK